MTEEEIQERAAKVLGSTEKASHWLTKSRSQFDGRSAMQMLDTKAGQQRVIEALESLDSGYFA